MADTSNHRIRRITRAGAVSTLAGSTSGWADGSAASARFLYPRDVAVDAAGNLYVGDTLNRRIRKITPAGLVSTVAGSGPGFADGVGTAARFANPTGVAVDAAGNVYAADERNARITVVN